METKLMGSLMEMKWEAGLVEDLDSLRVNWRWESPMVLKSWV